MEWIDQFIKDFDKKSLTQTEWYVAAPDGVEGPFNESELSAHIIRNRMQGETLVWNTNMSEWIQVEKLNHPLIKPFVYDSAQKLTDSIFSDSKEKELDFWVTEHTSKIKHYYPKTEDKVKATKKYTAIGIGIVVACAIGGYAYLNRNADIPYSNELTSEQLRDVKATRSEPLKSGLFGTVHLLGVNNPFPRFIISTNGKEEQNLTLKLEGIPGTLIGYARFGIATKVIVKDGIIVTNPVSTSMTKGIPVGDYKVSIICENCTDQRGIRRTVTLAEKKMFIGGEKNNEYDTGLRNFHFQLKTKARDELIYFKQLGEVLYMHYSDLKTLDPKKAGDHRHAEMIDAWKAGHEQYMAEFKNMTEKYKKGEFFYEKYVYNLIELFRTMNAMSEAKFKKFQAEEFNQLGNQFQVRHDQLTQERVRLETIPLMANGRPQAD